MTGSPLRVVKLGGSLFDLPELRERLRAWLALQSPAGTVLVVGGGALANAIRRADRLHGLSAESAHWLCIRAMSLNARLAAELLRDAALAADTASIRRLCAEGRFAILDPWPFLHEEEPRLSDSPLPCSWEVTSDSIAARLASILSAIELVLLKSALPNPGTDLHSAALSGYVDPFFPRAAAGLQIIRCVDLRSDGFSTTRLQ